MSKISHLAPKLLGLTLGLLNTGTALASFHTGTGGADVPIGEPENILPGFKTVQGVIKTIFNLVIIIAGTIFVILLLVGGIQYLTAAGNEEATGKAKKLIVDSVVGLIIVLAAWAIGTFVISRLGLSTSGPIRPQ